MITDPDQELSVFFSSKDLDLRKSKFSRFMDQKVTPDVLCFIADCILNLPDSNTFTTKDIWNSQYFEKNVMAIFGKPSPKNSSASNEYDKFIIQQLRTLNYAGVLDSVKKGQGYTYSIRNFDVLQFISIKERNAYLFLYHYIHKFLSDSGLLNYFETFEDKCKKKAVTNEDYIVLRDRFIQFIRGHTPINQDVEIKRIFPKILNIYACMNGINGSVKGRLSKYEFQWSDLMYNRLNWRDRNKAKGKTRKEAKNNNLTHRYYVEYLINKAKALINKKYSVSEVKDSYSNGPASHVHHIFPVATFPKISEYLENLIKLTPTQHLSKAHPNGNTKLIDRDYQCVCLMAKSKSIEDSLNAGELFYTLPNFIHVINIGLSKSLSDSLDFNQIRIEINHYYNGT